LDAASRRYGERLTRHGNVFVAEAIPLRDITICIPVMICILNAAATSINSVSTSAIACPARTGFRHAIGIFLLLASSYSALAQHAASAPVQPGPIIVGYFGQWGVYDHFFVKNLLTSGAAAQLDQINYSQGSVTGAHCGIADPNADLQLPFAAADSVSGIADNPSSAFKGDLHQLAELKKRFPRLKILISLEGHAPDFAIAAQPANRAAFVASCIDTFIRGHFAPGAEDPNLFDGIDLDWEYPKAEDAENFIALLTELREAMNRVRPGLRLSVAVGPSPQMYAGVDMAALSRIVDQIGIMNYDYTGPWNATTGFLAPLYSDTGGSVEKSILGYQAAGVPPHQLLMGMPFYGYGWQQVGSPEHGLHQQGQAIHGDRPYSFIETLASTARPEEASSPGTGSTGVTEATATLPAATPTPAQASAPADLADKSPTPSAAPFTIYRDPRSQAPWLYDGNTFWTFDDPISIRFKVGFAREQHLGGIMAWELSEDTADAALLRAARSSLAQPLPAHDQESQSFAQPAAEMRER
jgi:chitinase